jgi:long-chain acyl-CoA synthetase
MDTVRMDMATRLPRAPRTLAWLARRLERSLAQADLSLPEYRLLAVIAENAAGSSLLAGRLAVSKPRVTALADRLASNGYLERRHSPHDRRRVDHVLTDEGRAALDRADAAVAGSIERILDELSPAEVEVVEEAFGHLERALAASRERAQADKAQTAKPVAQKAKAKADKAKPAKAVAQKARKKA